MQIPIIDLASMTSMECLSIDGGESNNIWQYGKQVYGTSRVGIMPEQLPALNRLSCLSLRSHLTPQAQLNPNHLLPISNLRRLPLSKAMCSNLGYMTEIQTTFPLQQLPLLNAVTLWPSYKSDGSFTVP